MREYAVYTDSPSLLEVIEFVKQHQLPAEYHINRIRVQFDSSTAVHTEFLLRFSACASLIEPRDS
jgi:hypothetical protein